MKDLDADIMIVTALEDVACKLFQLNLSKHLLHLKIFCIFCLLVCLFDGRVAEFERKRF